MKITLRAMALTCFFCTMLSFISSSPAYDGTASSGTPQVQTNTHRRHRTDNSLMRDFLKRARRYRNEGRYELARQSYVQALSVCSDEETLLTIRNELDGIELLLRTMR